MTCEKPWHDDTMRLLEPFKTVLSGDRDAVKKSNKALG